ncbi:Type VI secretion lipoprotein/VasD [Marinobacterium lacunae]|uniref:Type VI secretion lipoprotein/VasD n=2 Tax=Marinobacterium lacunae TaxID=1232683 RepID=A0A081G3B5_9GAMM|nr:Type VI secretion lipoprotein/VasD [Marinobacterium lacunae]
MADRPSTLTYSMYAIDNVNLNAVGDATPLELVVYELEDDSRFLGADYDSLSADDEKALGSNYIDHSDYTLLPGQFKFVDRFTVSKDTRYIGLMARFSDPEASQWKKVVKIKPAGREYHLLMYFSEQDVVLDKVE